MNQWHSDLLHSSAAKWGVEVMPGRPLIDINTVPQEYVKLPVVEEFTWQDRDRPWRYVRIKLVTLNGLWSYTYDYQLSGNGGCFGPFMKFCNPYQTRVEALAHAVAALRKRIEYGPVLTWLDYLIMPRQLGLFVEVV